MKGDINTIQGCVLETQAAVVVKLNKQTNTWKRGKGGGEHDHGPDQIIIEEKWSQLIYDRLFINNFIQ